MLVANTPGGCRVGGGWSDKTKLLLISTYVKVVVEVEVELGKITEPLQKVMVLFDKTT